MSQIRDRSDELAPCPRCGDDMPWYEVSLGGLICRITCETCGATVYRCTIGEEGYATDAAIAAWNAGELDE